MLMNYMDCISINHPTVITFCTGDPFAYEDILWEGGDVIPPKEELDALIFNQFKNDKITELSSDCQKVIISGFVSSALGYEAIYDSEEVDQLNLIGAISVTSPTPTMPAGYTYEYAVRPVINGVTQLKTYIEHTHFQLRQVLADGAVFKLSCLQKFNTKRNYVNTLTTFDTINSVTWNSNEN